jgi:hypothetical protein
MIEHLRSSLFDLSLPGTVLRLYRVIDFKLLRSKLVIPFILSNNHLIYLSQKEYRCQNMEVGWSYPPN